MTDDLYVLFDLVGDVRNNLHSLSKKIAATFFFYHIAVDSSRGDVVCLRGLVVKKSLVMPQIQVCLCSVNCDITFSVFVRIKCSGIDVQIRVEFLDCDMVAACLQQFTD